ncbi:hypothetical protein Dimus_017207 [Dionaea muscipula]
MAMSAASSQLSCFISIHRNNLQSHPLRSVRCLALRSKFTVVMSLEGYNAETHRLNKKANLSYAADLSMSCVEDTGKSYSIADKVPDGNVDVNGPANPSPQKRAAKIHDFCFGIPFGGFVLTGGLLGFVFSRNLEILHSGMLFGGAILVLSSISLKIWRQGKSSSPFILGQAVLSASLFWKSSQLYSLTGKFFPWGLFAAMSVAMLCFYSYVVISGGNPPPKKLKLTANVAI